MFKKTKTHKNRIFTEQLYYKYENMIFKSTLLIFMISLM